MTVEQGRVSVLCREGAKLLTKVSGVKSGMALLQALADVESSYGINANSRHENGYCRGGRYYDPGLTRLHGCSAHCSYGIWQVMFPTAKRVCGFDIVPRDLEVPETNLVAATLYINEIIDRGANSVEMIADAYNSGSFKDSIVPTSYIAKVVAAYEGFLR